MGDSVTKDKQDFILIMDSVQDIILKQDSPDDIVLTDSFPGADHYDPYTGSYDINPVFNQDQILPTKNKALSANVKVRQIKVTHTTNPSGGMTVLIG